MCKKVDHKKFTCKVPQSHARQATQATMDSHPTQAT